MGTQPRVNRLSSLKDVVKRRKRQLKYSVLALLYRYEQGVNGAG